MFVRLNEPPRKPLGRGNGASCSEVVYNTYTMDIQLLCGTNQATTLLKNEI